MTYQIQPSFISKEAFLKIYSTLYYGMDETWLAIMTPDEKVCALALKSFPGSHNLLQRYQKQALIKTSLSLKETLPCLLVGTPLQHQVWKALLEVPRGTTWSYQQLATYIKRPKAVRAVANAVGANPISPLIPCHRIIRSGGYLGGYYWGLDVKAALLREEGVDVENLIRS